MNSLRRHLTYANTMATIAVFVALGGTAGATGMINAGAHSAQAVSLYPDRVSGDLLTGKEGAGTATATCRSGQVVIAGSYTDQRGGFSGTPKVSLDYAQRRVLVAVTFIKTNNGQFTNQIRAVADCIGGR